MSSAADRFIRAYTAETEAAHQAGGVAAMRFRELVAAKPAQHRTFHFESEQAQNFDAHNVDKAREGVKEILRDAITKAKTMAVQIKETAREEGHAAGYKAGLAAGEAKAREEFSPLLETLQKCIGDLSGFRGKMYSKLEREMIEMVISLTKKVIKHELSVKEASIQQMIRIAVESVMDRESMTIRVHPDDKDYAEAYRPELLRMFGEIKNLKFEGDLSLRRGDCLIETNFGTIDARVDKIFQQIDRILEMAPPPIEPPQPENPA